MIDSVIGGVQKMLLFAYNKLPMFVYTILVDNKKMKGMI